MLSKANEQLLETLEIKNHNVIYTSNATEANNLAIFGICDKHKKGKIITTKIEHPSVLACFKDLEKLGFNVTYLNVNQDGIIDLKELESSITKNTILISIMWVNNIVGSIQPIKKIIDIVKKFPRIKFHSDLVQGITKIKPNFNLNDLDFVTFTAHKIHGLKGTAALICNENIKIEQITKGGHQQDNVRGGTVDVAGAVCLAKALEIENNKLDENYQYVNNLYKYLYDKLSKLSFIKINSSINHSSPYVLSFSLNNLKGETFMHYLEQYGIYLGFGSACNAKTKELEPTIMSMFNDEKRASNTVRISLSADNTKEEIDIFIEKLIEVGNN